jgi:hypothetical protein
LKAGAVAVLLILLVVASVGITYLVEVTLQRTNSHSTTTTTSDTGLGLTLTLSLNNTEVRKGSTLDITVYATNTRDVLNNLSADSHWRIVWLESDSQTGRDCPYFFANVQVIRGYYTLSNVTTLPWNSTALLQLVPFVPGHMCHAPFGMWQAFFPFQPHQAVVGYTYSVHGYYPVNATYTYPPWSYPHFLSFRPLEVEVYTVVAGDEWGDLVLLHFSVVNPS